MGSGKCCCRALLEMTSCSEGRKTVAMEECHVGGGVDVGRPELAPEIRGQIHPGQGSIETYKAQQRCRSPGCQVKTAFSNNSAHRNHLKEDHGVDHG